MRVLLAHNSLYAGSFGGGDKSNRLLMEALAARGHNVRVVARAERFDEGSARVVESVLNGVEVHTLVREPRVRAYFTQQIVDFDPDIILTSTDDPAGLLLEAALKAPRVRVVHLVRATIAVPFGPDSSMKSTARTEMLKRADAVVGVSEYVSRYVREFGGMDAVHVPISLMEPRHWNVVGRFDNRYVTMANPCAVKGIDIFVELARRMPETAFAGVPTWGTNEEDLAKLRSQPNITILEPVSDMDRLFEQTRVLVVPSVWAEARSRVVVEAMLAGVPVIASDVGGIPEAKLGVPYLLPVHQVMSYRATVDSNMVPVAEVPPQNVDPWEATLRRLVSDREHWVEIAGASRCAALAYATKLSVEPFEKLLEQVVTRPSRRAAAAVASVAGVDATAAAKQKLLALRLKQRSWFPGAHATASGETRVFCFPHAGGGTLAYRGWSLGEGLAVCPVALPGREARAGEPLIEDIETLVAELVGAIRPYLDRPFAFFGHSMGAGIAFELTRALRRSGLEMPRLLVASGARAPQYRLNWSVPPEPSDEELLAMLPEHEEAASKLLPVLRADTRLYSRYVYTPEPPLDVPIAAFGGEDDPRVRPEHLDAWREQTRLSFERREFGGGHFYLRAQVQRVTSAVRALLTSGTA